MNDERAVGACQINPAAFVSLATIGRQLEAWGKRRMDSCEVEGLEPLLPEIWISRIERMVEAVPNDEELERYALARLLRLTFHLCILAPPALRIAGLGPAEEADLEALLGARQYDGAAMLLLGPEAKVDICRAGNVVEARIGLFAGKATGRGTAATLAQAVLAALVDCLLLDHALIQALRTYPLADESLRKFQSGSHP